jgi:hypothetical protein
MNEELPEGAVPVLKAPGDGPAATGETGADRPAAPLSPKKRKKGVSMTKRTLDEMRKRGYLCAVVEKFNKFAGVTQDLYGFIDVLCCGDGEIVGVQTTSSDNMAARIDKIANHENTAAVRKAGMRLLVHGWRKNAEGRWVLREVDVS